MKEKNKLLIIILVLIVLVGGSAILYNVFKDRVSNEPIPENNTQSQSQSQSQNEESTAPMPAPDFTVFDKDGNEVTLSSLKGKPVVLNFWASWCGPCKIEMKDFNNAYSKYKDDIHFAMVNLTDGYRETIKSASKYVEEQGFSFPIYFDTENQASNAYRVYSVPTTYFIDSKGNLVVYVNGLIDENTLQKGIDMIYSQTEE